MVPFSGYSLPVQYPDRHHRRAQMDPRARRACSTSRIWARASSSSTDTSGDAEADHEAIAALVEPLVCGDIARAEARPDPLHAAAQRRGRHPRRSDDRPADAALSGGSLYVIVNAGTKDADWAHIADASGRPRDADPGRRWRAARAAGPRGVAVLEAIVPGRRRSRLHDLRRLRLARHACCIVSRSGYTGEDGFEILVAPSHAAELWNALLADARVKPDRPRRPRQPAPRGRAAALRPRPRRHRLAHRGRRSTSPSASAAARPPISPAPRASSREFAGDLTPHPRRPLRRGRTGPRGRRHPRCGTAAPIGRVTSGGFSPIAQPRHRPRLRRRRPRRARHQAAGRRPRPPAARRSHPASLRPPSLCPEGHVMTTKYTEDHEYIRVDGDDRHRRHHQLRAGPARRHRLRRAARASARS